MTADVETARTPQGPTGLGGRFRARTSYWQRDRWTGYLFVGPQLVGFAVFVGIPLIAVMRSSFQLWNVLAGNPTFAGLTNYARMAEDTQLLQVLRNTAVFSAGLVPLNIVLALVLALLLNQQLRGTSVMRIAFFSPVVVSLVAWAIVWRFLLDADGGINLFLGVFGIDGPNWLRQPGTAMGSLILVQVLKNVGLNMVLFLAALQSVPEDVLEAARVDGAALRQRLRHVTLPLIAPTILMVSIITVIGSLRVFAMVTVLTGGGPGNSTNVLVYHVYRTAFQLYDAGYASALAVLLFVIVLILTLIQWQLRKRWVFHEQ